MTIEQKTLIHNGKIVFKKAVILTNYKRVPKFYSENEACFLFVTEGSFRFRTPTTLLTYNKNEAILAKCGNYFIEQISQNVNSKEEKFSGIGAYFYPEMVRSFFDTDLLIKDFQNNYDVVKVNVQPLMKSFVESVEFLLDNPSIADENIILHKLKELLLILCKSEKANSINAFVSSLFEPHEYDFNEIIQKNIYSDLTLEDFAKLCNCSLSTFKRKFLKLYKETPAKYISIKKLEKSIQLLQIKSKPIAEIAYDCGFETVSNFNRAFKLLFGKTPTEYRLN